VEQPAEMSRHWGEPINEDSWETVERMVSAAAREDLGDYRAATERFAVKGIDTSQCYRYMAMLLVDALWDRWDRDQSPRQIRKEIHKLTKVLYPRWDRILTAGPRDLETTLIWGRQLVTDMIADAPKLDFVAVSLRAPCGQSGIGCFPAEEQA
jgi:hypothetical protein